MGKTKATKPRKPSKDGPPAPRADKAAVTKDERPEGPASGQAASPMGARRRHGPPTAQAVQSPQERLRSLLGLSKTADTVQVFQDAAAEIESLRGKVPVRKDEDAFF